MHIISNLQEAHAYCQAFKCQGKRIGLIPTMGALHHGHMSLVQASLDENDVTVGSVFVNPIQFNDPEDYKKYPRTSAQDIAKLKGIGCDMVFTPSPEDMYPGEHFFHFEFGALTQHMEGAFRPGHFDGVVKVVAKFFHILQPDRAYFGQKDFQQFTLIKRMVDELSFFVEVKDMPIIREPHGLAMSSRNERLSEEGRYKAKCFYEALQVVEKQLQNGLEVSGAVHKAELLLKEVKGVKLEYLEVVDAMNLAPVKATSKGHKYVACIAGYIEGVRLIDNMYIIL